AKRPLDLVDVKDNPPAGAQQFHEAAEVAARVWSVMENLITGNHIKKTLFKWQTANIGLQQNDPVIFAEPLESDVNDATNIDAEKNAVKIAHQEVGIGARTGSSLQYKTSRFEEDC